MALIVNLSKMQGKDKEAYVRIEGIVVSRGRAGTRAGSGMSAIDAQGNSIPILPSTKFNSQVRYSVKQQGTDGQDMFTFGELNVPYDLTSTSNSIQFAYEKMKEHPWFKDAKDDIALTEKPSGQALLDYYRELVEIKGIADKIALEIIAKYSTKEKLREACKNKADLPFHDNVDKLLMSKYGG